MKKQIWMFLIVSLILAFGFSTVPAKSKRYSHTTWLGITTQTVDDDLAGAFDLPVEYGVIINQVIDDSPAEEAGLEEDDIIISFNGDKIAL